MSAWGFGKAEPSAIPWEIEGQQVKMCTQDDWTEAMEAAAHVYMKAAHETCDEPEECDDDHDLPGRPGCHGRNLQVEYANDPDWDRIFFFRQDGPWKLIINYAQTKDIIESGDYGSLMKLFPKELRP